MRPELLTEFAPLFFPRSLAIIGASSDLRKYGGRFLKALLAFGYQGQIFPVNLQEREIFGLKVYPSVRDIPQEVDLASVNVPAAAVPGTVAECLAKGVKGVEIFTAGFAEAGPEGQRLEADLQKFTGQGMRLIGPNCFGIYCPAGGLTILPGADFPRESGHVAFISQSGGLAARIGHLALGLNLRFSKLISYGNACDVNEADLLEYLALDPETHLIAAYVEGVRAGPRFFNLLKQVALRKPVLLWKGGLTKTGGRAVASHTASLAGEESTWAAVFRQAKVIKVNSLEEIVEVALAFTHLPENLGLRLGVVGGGGAISVAAGDACERAGLQVPALSPDIQEKLKKGLPPAGASFRNPVDLGSPFPSAALLRSALETVAASPQVDVVVIDQIILSGRRFYPFGGEGDSEVVGIPIKIKERFGKPMVVIFPEIPTKVEHIDLEIEQRQARDLYLAAGIPVYYTLDQGVRAIAAVARYYQARQAEIVG